MRIPRTNPQSAPRATIAQGDCLSSIAKQQNFYEYGTICGHANNADFRKRNPNPNILNPGDQLFIPDKIPKPVSRPTDAQHKFVLKGTKPVKLRIVLKDNSGALANPAYELNVQSETIKGSTDGSGLLEHVIPADALEGTLTVKKSLNTHHHTFVWTLQLGCLDPADQVSGAQGRPSNLGYFCGAVDGTLGPRTQAALRSYQRVNGLTETGDLSGTHGPLSQQHDVAG